MSEELIRELDRWVWWCERHEEYASRGNHLYCSEHGFVSRWERRKDEGRSALKQQLSELSPLGRDTNLSPASGPGFDSCNSPNPEEEG